MKEEATISTVTCDIVNEVTRRPNPNDLRILS